MDGDVFQLKEVLDDEMTEHVEGRYVWEQTTTSSFLLEKKD